MNDERKGTFWLYAGLGICATVFCLRFVPEIRETLRSRRPSVS